MAITIKNEHEIALMRESGRLLALVHEEMRKELKEGMTTKDIDRICETMIRDFGCIPNFLNVHGIPSKKRYIESGDIVSLDAGLIYKGYHSDAARTHGVGEISPEAQRIIDVTKQSFFEGIKFAKPGNHLVDIARGIQTYAESNGYSVVRDLTGHGIGTKLHEAPEIPNFVQRRGAKMQKGMALAIEPMINEGTYDVYWLDNDWTVATVDGKLSAHYENTIAITDEGCEILTMLPEEKEALHSEQKEK